MKTLIRKAKLEERDSIYLMGIDVWSDGKTEEEYLAECRSSPKYKRGEWYVLVDEKNRPLSSLITYQLAENTVGIGSIATPKSLRQQGYASQLISGVISQLESKEQNKVFFLFADIKPDFYQRFGFTSLPAQFQKYDSSVCMIRNSDNQKILSDINFEPPTYF